MREEAAAEAAFRSPILSLDAQRARLPADRLPDGIVVAAREAVSRWDEGARDRRRGVGALSGGIQAGAEGTGTEPMRQWPITCDEAKTAPEALRDLAAAVGRSRPRDLDALDEMSGLLRPEERNQIEAWVRGLTGLHRVLWHPSFSYAAGPGARRAAYKVLAREVATACPARGRRR